MIDAVLSYHTNVLTCGVAKFSARLARELGVPHDQLWGEHRYRLPLLSIKFDEVQRDRALIPLPSVTLYELFLHDAPIGRAAWLLVLEAERVYAANGVIAQAVRRKRADVIEAWCPSLIETPPPRAALTVLTFGMAHKQQDVLPHYQKLKALLDAHGQPYTILVSTGVHEGSPWDEALEASGEAMRDIFGSDRVELLGYLSDAALHREILAATACAAFYSPALRANNTSAWAVLERGRPLITNCDQDSPFRPGIDIQHMKAWPSVWPMPIRVSGWTALYDLFQGLPCAS